MIRKCLLFFFVSVLLQPASFAQRPGDTHLFAEIQSQVKQMLVHIPSSRDNEQQVVPRSCINNKLKIVRSGDWTSGFFPGILWYLFEYSKDSLWRDRAIEYTAYLEKEKYNRTTHDLGFMIYCSFGNGLRITGDSHYRSVVITAANTISRRFNRVAGVIKSWDNRTEWKYPVIIDNMMNLELLFAATKLTGDSTYYRIAVTHADNTMKNHFRPDNSSYHVLDYDTLTGNVTQRTTHQGYSDASSWARGQAWGLYGFVMCYRETGDRRYLEQAEKIAAYILDHPSLPADLVPYWDYDVASKPGEPRDASAAAITASALYELDHYSKERSYRSAADKITANLTAFYRSKPGENRGFVLQHSTGHRPANSEVDVPMIYADYYYIEALLRKYNIIRSIVQ